MKRLLIVIPAYNEEENIKLVVDKLIKEYSQFDYVIINDGSTDSTAQICKDNNYNLLDLPVNLGLAGAFQAGMRYALYKDYDYAIQFDGDGQHNPEYIEGMMNMAEDEGMDLVIGSRFIGNQKKNISFRMFGNSLIGVLIFLTTGKVVKDTTSGMRMYNKKMIRKLAYQMNYGPEPDTIAYLIRCGARVGEYPVTMNERIAGESYLSFTNGIKYMFHMVSSILVVQWFRKRR